MAHRLGSPQGFRAKFAIGILVLAGATWLVVLQPRHPGRSAEAAQASNPSQAVAATPDALVELYNMKRQSIPRWTETTGSVKAELEASLAAKLTARIVRLDVREGDRVRAGQRLVELDARDLDAAIEQAQAGVQSAHADYTTARTTAVMETSTSAAAIEEARAQVGEDEAALRGAAAKYDLVRAGPRHQEREQASLGVNEADASCTLAKSNLDKMATLYREGAISKQIWETTAAEEQVAAARLAVARQQRSILDEGSRTEDIRAAAQAVDVAKAAFAQAQAGLKHAQAAALQADVRREEIHSAAAKVTEENAVLDSAQITRVDALIVAPFSGVVSARLADPGGMASPGSPLLKVEGGQMRLEAVVPESMMGFIRREMQVPVTLDALPGRPVTGTVVETAPQGDPASHTFIVKLALPEGHGIRSGMFGRARFNVGEDQMLMAPTSAVWERQGLHYVYVIDSRDTAHLRMVTVGDPDDGRIPVLSGLNEGDRIVARDTDRVAEGAHILGQ